MADLKEVVSKALSFLDSKGKTIVLKAEQEKALYSLLEGNDVLVVLPTSFGKTMIFTMFSVAARERTLQAPVSVLVISPLNSIITDQIADLEGLCKAAELKADNLNAILKDLPRFIYASAEKVLEERFLRFIILVFLSQELYFISSPLVTYCILKYFLHVFHLCTAILLSYIFVRNAL